MWHRSQHANGGPTDHPVQRIEAALGEACDDMTDEAGAPSRAAHRERQA